MNSHVWIWIHLWIQNLIINKNSLTGHFLVHPKSYVFFMSSWLNSYLNSWFSMNSYKNSDMNSFLTLLGPGTPEFIVFHEIMQISWILASLHGIDHIGNHVWRMSWRISLRISWINGRFVWIPHWIHGRCAPTRRIWQG